MDFRRQEWIYKVCMCFASVVSLFVTTTALTSNSACFGTASTNATKMYLTCPDGQTIALINITAGAKATSIGCPGSFTDAMTQDIACCSPSANSADDCTFALVDTSDFEQSCNGHQSCEPEAKNEFTSGHCDMTFPVSTIFMFIDFVCNTSVQQSSSEDDDSDNLKVILPAVLVPVVVGIPLIGVAGYFTYKKLTRVNEERKTEPCDVNANEANDSDQLQHNLTREHTSVTVSHVNLNKKDENN